MAAKYELDLRDYIRILKKRKYTILFSAVVMGIFSYVFARMQEPTPIYQASASVKIEKSTNMAGLYMQSMAVGEGDNLETQAQIIRSYPIMEIVAKKIGKLDPNLTSAEIRQNNDLLNQVLDLKAQVETEREGYTNLINITVTSYEPKFCQKLANTVAEVYKDENIKEKNKRSDDAVQFIGNQLKSVKAKLSQAEETLKEYRENNKLISLDAQSRITLDQVTQSESLLNKLDSGMKEIQSMIRSLENKDALSTKSLEGGIFADQTSPSFLRLNDQLSNLRVSMDTLLLVYTEKHPDVLELNEQIEKISGNMLKELIAQLRTMEKRKGELAQSLAVAQEKFQALPQSGLNLARLERDAKLQGEVYAMLEEKYQEALIRQAEKVEEVSIVKPALEPYDPTNPPNTTSTAFIGVILGMTLGLVFSFISETLDTSIGTIEDVEEFIGVPVLGIIPFVSEDEVREILLKKADMSQDEEVLGRNARLVSHFAPHSTLAESYRTLRTNIQFASLEKNAKVIMLTSSSPKEGKSTTTANLSMTMAQVGLRTLLIDADMRKPMVNKVFGLEREPGLSDILLGNYELEESIKTVTDIMMGKMGMEDIMKTPGIDNLHIITSGVIPPNPSELLNSPRMKEFIETVREMYDVVIFDTTPILPATDAAVLGSKVDSVVLVYKAGAIARGALKRAKVQMDNVNAKVLGVVLNALKSEVSSDFQDYRYDTYYSYGAEQFEEPETIREKLEDYFQKAYKKFEEHTDTKKARMAILGVCLALMFGGILISELQLTGFKPMPVAAEKDDNQTAMTAAGTPGIGPTQSPEGGSPGEGPPAGSTPGLPPGEGMPPSQPGQVSGESLDLPATSGGFSIWSGLVLVLFLVGMGFAVRWYLLSKEEDEDEDEEAEEGDGEGEASNDGQKDPYGGAKHVDLSLDLPAGSMPEGMTASGSSSFQLPGEMSTGSFEFVTPGTHAEGAITDFSFNLPDLNAQQGEIPGMESFGSMGGDSGLPDFKFTIPGMGEDSPATDESSSSAFYTPGSETTTPTAFAQDAADLGAYSEETVINSSFKGFAKPERFGELDGEELPDFSEFGKIDWSQESGEENFSVEKVNAVPHPEGGALDSFPEERTSAPFTETSPVREPTPEIPSEAVESHTVHRAITWDTTPLPQIDTLMNGLSSFSGETGHPTEEKSSFEFSEGGEDIFLKDDWSLQSSEDVASQGETSFFAEGIPTEELTDTAEAVFEEQGFAFEQIPSVGESSEEIEPVAEAEIIAGEIQPLEGIMEGDFLEEETEIATESFLAPLEEIPCEGEIIEVGEFVLEGQDFPSEEIEPVAEAEVIAGEIQPLEGIMEGDILEEEAEIATESFLAPLEEIPCEDEIIEVGEFVLEGQEFLSEEIEPVAEAEIIAGEIQPLEGMMEGDILEEETEIATESFLAPLEEIPCEGEIIEVDEFVLEEKEYAEPEKEPSFTRGKQLVEEVELASMEEALSKKKKAPKITREDIEKKISREMMEEGEDINQILKIWQAQQKEELEAHFRKKQSMEKLKHDMDVLEKKVAAAKKFNPAKAFLQKKQLEGNKFIQKTKKPDSMDMGQGKQSAPWPQPK
jgi:capsular exopolysaccharide synthesis family protein